MTITDQEIARLRDQVRLLTDRVEISRLIDQFFVSLDTRDDRPFDDDWARSLLTEDIAVSFPVGHHQGIDTLVQVEREAMALFGPTQHLTANHLIDIDGDRATLRWDVIQTHNLREPGRDLFVSAGSYDGEAIRTAVGWRLRYLAYTLAWRTGQPPVDNTAYQQELKSRLGGPQTLPGATEDLK
ncbi:nuclear transport factor 2 family protein [Kribbella kalugense]|uniref:SnoaL-like protein n=1 Tax=Kribbella kalugense TaxID=2512221 RepID=A0A4R8A449_9ACTN|nr:nuclear transport factor 2 family protein [Kribbella kalugense]TDW24238.1 SnoaL-like protein [Kribbella kalugense]